MHHPKYLTGLTLSGTDIYIDQMILLIQWNYIEQTIIGYTIPIIQPNIWIGLSLVLLTNFFKYKHNIIIFFNWKTCF